MIVAAFISVTLLKDFYIFYRDTDLSQLSNNHCLIVLKNDAQTVSHGVL